MNSETQLRFDPALLDSVKSLEWFARTVARKVGIGRHRSSRLATGMEFDQFRHYTPGDDLRLLDWKKYARTGKYYLRQAIQEDHHELTIVLDDSASMAYQEEGISKFDIGRLCTAALTYLLIEQRDACQWLADRSQSFRMTNPSEWRMGMEALLSATTEQTFSGPKEVQTAESVIITDFYADLDVIEKQLEIIAGSSLHGYAIHLVGRKEESLDFSGNLSFVDLETGNSIPVDAKQYKEDYNKELKEHHFQVRQLCFKYGILYNKAYMGDSPVQILTQLLNAI